MCASACIVRRVQEVVERRGLKVTRVVVFHGLEVQVCCLCNTSVAAAGTITENRARNVCAVTGVFVRRGAVTDDVKGANHASPEITVIFVETGISDRNGLPRPVKVGGEVCRHGAGLHVTSRLVVKRSKSGICSKVHHRWLQENLLKGNFVQEALISPAVPRTCI